MQWEIILLEKRTGVTNVRIFLMMIIHIYLQLYNYYG